MNKSIKILLGIFAILIAVYFLFFRSGEKVSTEKIDAKLFVADSSKIDKIEIVKISETVVFEKSGNQWKITKPIQYAADTTAVNAMLKDLKNFMLESVASENPAKFSGYLDSVNNATIATYQEGKLLGTFILGKSQANDNSYIKNPNENRILLASKLTATNFTKALKDYRDKFIVSMNTMGVNKIVFKSTDSNNVDFTAQKDSVNIWRINGDSVSSSVMEGFLNMFNKFNTEDFKDTVMTVFPTPTFTITFTGTGAPTVVNLYKENSEPPAFICQVTGVNQLFKLYSGVAGQLMKKKTDFVPAPPKK